MEGHLQHMMTRLIVIFVGVVFALPLAADEIADQTAVESAKDALAGSGRFPWYDRTKDDVRPLRISSRESELDRDEKWAGEQTASTPTTTTRTRSSVFGGALQWIGLTTLILLLGLIAYFIVTAFLKEEMSDSAAVRKVVESRRDADRVEALPFQVRAVSGDFQSEARRLYEAGNYSQAIIYLFSHELVELDRHHVIRLAKGKTNRQYIRETRSRPGLAAILEGSMIVFEDAFFGKKAITREAFERCWRQLDAFQTELDRMERAAA
jgi:hypothetical protein